MNNFLVDEKILTAVLNYLGNRPYIEVAELIRGIQTARPAPEDKDVDTAEIDQN